VVELGIASVFGICRTRFARKLVELVPSSLIGFLFDMMRRAWKKVSKPVKRKGMDDISFEIATWTLDKCK